MEHPENSGEYKGLVVNAGIEQPSSVESLFEAETEKTSTFRCRVCRGHCER